MGRNGVKVAKLDDNGNVIETYNSIIEASKKNFVSVRKIFLVLKGDNKTCIGHKWIRLRDLQ